MHKVKVLLNGIEKARAFNNTVCKYDVEFDLVSGRYVIDAKSIMGIFSLDLSKVVGLHIHTEDKELIEQIEAALNDFIVWR